MFGFQLLQRRNQHSSVVEEHLMDMEDFHCKRSPSFKPNCDRTVPMLQNTGFEPGGHGQGTATHIGIEWEINPDSHCNSS